MSYLSPFGRASARTFRGVAFALLAAQLVAFSSAARAAERVLFIGNSFTYGHVDPIASFNRDHVTDLNKTKMGGIPGIFKQLTQQAGLDYDVSIEAVGGQTLAYHVLNKSAELTQSQWDTVILQAYSSESLPRSHAGDPQNFYVGAAELVKLIRSKSPAAKIFGYSTWSSPTQLQWQKYPPGPAGLHEMSDEIEHGFYKMIFDQKLAGIVRVGSAFEKALDEHIARPDPSGPESDGIDLWYAGDHRHPSVKGSYLSALMFYAKLTKKDPRELSTGEGSAAATLKIEPDVAKKLAQVAYEMNAAPEPERGVVTTQHPALKFDLNSGIIQSVSTAEGDFASVVAGFPQPSAGMKTFEFKKPLTQLTRFVVVAPAADQTVTVILDNVSGKSLSKYNLVLNASNFGPPNSEKLSAATFSLSDLGVADMSDVAQANGLALSSKHWSSPIMTGVYDAPAPTVDSLFVIGSGPPKIPPQVVKKKPTTKPAKK